MTEQMTPLRLATHLLENGVDIHLIQDLLGHRNIASTTRYARVAINTNDDHVVEAASGFEPPACPCCGGRMKINEIFEHGSTARYQPTRTNWIDTS